jgi:integrase
MTATLETAVAGFIEHKRAIGRKYHSEEAELALLVRFAREHGAGRLEDLTPALVDDFLASRPRARPRSFNHLRGVVSGLLQWAVINELIETAPLTTRRRRTSSGPVPFLFDMAQARRLLDAAGALPDNSRAAHRGQTYRTIFALCYGLGLRAGEACGLRLGDVDPDRQLLVVRGGKFGKSRLVPHGPRIGELVTQQAGRRRAGGAGEDAATPLFTFNGRTPVNPCTASQVFHHLVPTLGLTIPDGVAPPRLHSLRHSFAVACLLRWYRDGADPAGQLFRLSTFMGHVSPVSTAVYLTITDELRDEASRHFEAFAAPAWEKAGP